MLKEELIKLGFASLLLMLLELLNTRVDLVALVDLSVELVLELLLNVRFAKRVIREVAFNLSGEILF